MPELTLTRLVRLTTVALERGFIVETTPTGMGGAFVRLRKNDDSGTVYIQRNGELSGWRTGRRRALEQLKAALAQADNGR